MPGEHGESVYALGVDNDISVDKNNVTVNFGGRWVRINNQWLYCVKIDQLEDIVTYQSPVLVDSREALLIFTYNKKSFVLLPYAYYQYSAFVTDVYGHHFNAGTAMVEIKNGGITVIAVTNDDISYPH